MCDVLTDVLCDMMGCDVSCSVVMGCDVTWWDGMGWGGMCDVGQTSYVESLSTQLPVTMIIGPKSLKFPLWSFFGMWMFPCGSNPRCWYFWQSPPLDGSQFLQVNGTQSCPFNPMTLAAPVEPYVRCVCVRNHCEDLQRFEGHWVPTSDFRMLSQCLSTT